MTPVKGTIPLNKLSVQDFKGKSSVFIRRMSVIQQHNMIVNPLNFSKLLQNTYTSDGEEIDFSSFTPMSNVNKGKTTKNKSKISHIEIFKDVLKPSINEAIGKGKASWYPNFEYGMNKVPNKWKDVNKSARIKDYSEGHSKNVTNISNDYDPSPSSSAMKAFCKPSFLSKFDDVDSNKIENKMTGLTLSPEA